MSIQALREQRAAKCDALNELVNKSGQWTADDQASYDAGMAEVSEIDASMKRHQEMNELAANSLTNGRLIEASQRLARDKGDSVAAGFAAWLRGDASSKNVSPEQIASEYPSFRNTMSTTTGSEGGYTVPTEVASTVLDALKAFGGMRAACTIITTETGAPMTWPTSDGTSEKGRRIAENTTVTRADPVFGTLSLPVYLYSSDDVAIPITLLQDSAVDIESFVRQRLVTRLGRITNDEFTTGTGSSQPNGVVTAASSGKVGATGQTTTVTFNDLLDLLFSVDPAYRENESFGWMMADSSLKAVSKLVDLEGRPIFLPAYDLTTRGPADTLLGKRITINQSMAAMAANAKSILAGDFSKYIIRDAMGISIFRFDDSAFMRNGQIGFLAYLRSGGNLMDVGGAVKYYQNSAT